VQVLYSIKTCLNFTIKEATSLTVLLSYGGSIAFPFGNLAIEK
jgi:hypothetical protein